MNKNRASSAPNLIPATSSSISKQQHDDSVLEGVAAHVKLLLKLIQEHKDACNKEKNDSRRMLRVATMMTILDNVRGRIQKCQSFGDKKSDLELHRCNTTRERNGMAEPVADEKEKLKKELNASLASRKSLEMMCSILGKEKEIMAAELSRKAHELNGMEEMMNDLKSQNETLREKVHEYASKHNKNKSVGGGEMKVDVTLQARNKALSKKLLRSLDGYRSMKRIVQEVQEDNLLMHITMDEMGAKVQSFKQRVSEGTDPPVDDQEEIDALENMFESLRMIVEKQGKCVKPKGGNVNVSKGSVLA